MNSRFLTDAGLSVLGAFTVVTWLGSPPARPSSGSLSPG
jgi:hypothetical protein